MREHVSGTRVTQDTLDHSRMTKLHRTLPTRQPGASICGSDGLISPLDWPEIQIGDPLPVAHHMVYFQPDDWLNHLAPDGTSTVRHASHHHQLL